MHPYPKHRKFINRNLSVWLKCVTITCTFCSHLRLPLFVSCVSKLLSQYYTCELWSHALGVSRVSRLRVQNFDLMLAPACGPISHAWLKNVSCCRLAWHNFQKYVNSDPCKERKPCVKWINDNTFLVISSFPDNFAFGRLRTSSEAFGHGLLRKTSDFFENLRKWSCHLQNSQHSQDKNLTPISQKKLAGIQYMVWTVII